MEMDAATLKQIVSKMSMKAQSLNVEVHPSFGVELVNYSRRLGLEDLESKEMIVVLEGLTEHALARHPSTLDAHAFQAVALELCDHPFRLCEAAARQVLIEKKMPVAAEKVQASLRKLLSSHDEEP